MSPLLKLKQSLPPIFFDLDDIEHIALRRSSMCLPLQLKSLVALAQVPALMRAERAAIKLSTTTFVCSALDVGKLSKRFGTNNVRSIPNSVHIPPAIARNQLPRLLMLGSYAYPPNRHGIERFVEMVLPLLRKVIPDVEILIAGANQNRLKFAAKPPPGVRLLGFVEDLNELYAQASAVVCPIYSGGGTRVKIIEAAAYGMPIVSTTIGAEGIDLKSGIEILIADDVHAFSMACARVLGARHLASRIGAAAKRKAIALYDRDVVVTQLANEFGKMVRPAAL
jgi:glycosyltransferase involved in cell wall biosynthesis